MTGRKRQILVSWVGGNDLKAIDDHVLGPVATTLQTINFDAAELLYNYPESQVSPYLSWLAARVDTPIDGYDLQLSSPVNFAEIYQQARAHMARLASDDVELSILLSPGTPAMQAVWILLGKTYYECRFYRASVEAGVQQVDIPFDLSAEYVPVASKLDSEKLSSLTGTDVPVDAALDNIITRNPYMTKLKARAQILA